MSKKIIIGIGLISLVLIIMAGIDRKNDKKEQELPSPAGFYRAGFTIQDLGGILTAVWYPSNASEQVYEYPGQGAGLTSMVAPEAAIAEGKYPLLFFAHGAYGCALNSVFFHEYLAQHGYIVVSVEFNDTEISGRRRQVANCRIQGGNVVGDLRVLRAGKNLVDTLNSSRELTLNYLQEHRLDPMTSVINKVLNPGFAFYQNIDQSKLGIMGHSLGGSTVIGTLLQDKRFKAVLLLSAPSYPFEETIANLRLPAMFMVGENDESNLGGPDNPRGASYQRISPPKYYLVLKDADHLAFVDRGYRDGLLSHAVENNAQAQAIAQYGLEFFNRYLLNKKADILNAKTHAFVYYIMEDDQGVQEWGVELPPGTVGPGGFFP